MPQWNCPCANCRAARSGGIPAQTQSCVAISADGVRWFLVNASPDLRAQIEGFPPLQPQAGNARNSPIEGVLVTNADLDHVLGLLFLRESGAPLHLHTTPAVRETLTHALRFDALLGAFCGVKWHEAPRRFAPLLTRDGSDSGLQYRAIFLPAEAPFYAKEKPDPGAVHSIAWQILDGKTGGRLLVAPDVGSLNAELRGAMEDSDAVLFDGTFWSEGELRSMNPNAKMALEMGHIPIERGSLENLRSLKARHKIYVHINNTNPIFATASLERATVERAGIAVGADGMEFEL